MLSDAPNAPSVLVLLATFNGVEFLESQIRSIQAQHLVDVTFFVVDDASTDSTVSLLREMIPAHQLCLTVNATRVGLPGAYLWLLANAPKGHALYAFSDQDDLWHKDKLVTAWQALSQLDDKRPALWVCNYDLLINNKNEINTFYRRPAAPSFGNALVDGIGPGCSMVWNPALQHALELPSPKNCIMHDRWMYASAISLGSVLQDENTLMTYRLHSNNSVGMDARLTSRVRRHWKAQHGESATFERQAAELEQRYGGKLGLQNRRIIRGFAHGNRFSRGMHWVKGDLKRHRTKDNVLLLFRLMLFTNKGTRATP